MERVLSESRPVDAPKARVVLESVITVPVDHVEWLVAALRKGGIDAWDTGDRVTTEERLGGLADLGVRVPIP